MMNRFLKEVGRGKRGSRDLTYVEALQVAEYIFNGTATAAQIGAFFMAERMKMESADELLGFIDYCRPKSLIHPIANSLDCAGPYDGRSRSFYATFPTAFVLNALDIPVTIHSSPSLPPKYGVTMYDLLHALNLPVVHFETDSLLLAAEKTGFLFVPTEKWCPPLGQLRDLREEIGMRTLLNMVEKLLRFSDSPYMTLGIYHGTVIDKMVKILPRLGVKTGLIVQGVEGSEDLSVAKRTRGYWVSPEENEWIVIDPELLELHCEYPDIQWTAKHQVHVMLSVLDGTAELPYYNTVLLNAGVRAWLCKKANSIEQGIYEAKYVIDNGYALEKYQLWKNMMTSVKRVNVL